MKTFFTSHPARIPFTHEGYQKVLDEKKRLLSERPSVVEDLRKAREMGDLSENGYYKASRAKLSALDANLRRIERLVRLGKIVESQGGDTIDIGSTVTVTDGKNTRSYSVVGGYESDPSKHTISHISPLGKALIGKKEGEEIDVRAPLGITHYTILRVNRSQ